MPIPALPTITGPSQLYDRVRESSTTTGTGTLTLLGAILSYQSFAVVGNGNPCYYCAVDYVTGDYEVGIGTYTLSGTTLSRTTVLASSNAGALVNFVTGVRDVFLTEAATIGTNAYFTGTQTVTVGNTTSTTTLLPTGVGINGIPAGVMIPGKTVRLKASGYWSNATIAPGTFVLNVNWGGTGYVTASTAAFTLIGTLSNVAWNLEVDLTCYTSGSSGTVSMQGRFVSEGTGIAGTYAGLVTTATQTYNTTLAYALGLTATWSSAQAANTITLTNLDIVPIN